MTTISEMTNFAVTPSSTVNGATTTYLISVTSNCILSGSITLKFTFPSEVTMPSTMSCTETDSKISSISCSMSSFTVTASITLSSTVSSGN
jgi:hypothetical protein